MNNKRLKVINIEYYHDWANRNVPFITLENKHIIMKIKISNQDFVKVIIKNKKTNQNKRYELANGSIEQINTIPKKYLPIIEAQIIAYKLSNL